MQENARHEEYPIPQAIWNMGKMLGSGSSKRFAGGKVGSVVLPKFQKIKRFTFR
jgi:hypothetical protein